MFAKLVAQLLLPLNLALELWILALLLRWRGWRRTSRAAGLVGLLVLLVSSTPRVASGVCRLAEREHAPVAVEESPTADAIVLLGGGVAPRVPPRLTSDLNEGGDRVLHAARLYRAGKAPLVVASGGSSDDGLPPEGPEMGILLREWGVPKEAILEESASSTTRENAEQTWRVLEPRGARRILLVTSALHMPRAAGAFRTVGFEVVPSVTDFRAADGPASWKDWVPDAGALQVSTEVARELMGRVYYGLRGWR